MVISGTGGAIYCCSCHVRRVQMLRKTAGCVGPIWSVSPPIGVIGVKITPEVAPLMFGVVWVKCDKGGASGMLKSEEHALGSLCQAWTAETAMARLNSGVYCFAVAVKNRPCSSRPSSTRCFFPQVFCPRLQTQCPLLGSASSVRTNSGNLTRPTVVSFQ